MYPSLTFTSLVISEDACTDTDEELACPSPVPGLYSTADDYNSTQESESFGPRSWAGATALLLRMGGNGVKMPGQMTLYNNGQGNGFVLPASEHAFTRSDDFIVHYPGGQSYTMAVGAVSKPHQSSPAPLPQQADCAVVQSLRIQPRHQLDSVERRNAIPEQNNAERLLSRLRA